MSILDRILGSPLASHEEEGQKIGVGAGIPILGLDALSSSAYGPEAALTVLLLIGGGAYLGVTNVEQPVVQAAPEAAVVHDLQTLDSNKQVLDQLEAISDNPDDAITNDPNSDDPTAQ